MDSLYKLILTLPEADWNYCFQFQNNLAIPKPIVGKITSVDFINRYFKKGGKENTILDFNLNDFRSERADHTVSIFFFGLLLFHNTGIKSRLFYQDVISEKYEFFQFIWFMTCLSHDLAFYQEERSQNSFKITQIWSR